MVATHCFANAASVWSSAKTSCKIRKATHHSTWHATTHAWLNAHLPEKVSERWVVSYDVRSVIRILRNGNCEGKLRSSLTALLTTKANTPLAKFLYVGDVRH